MFPDGSMSSSAVYAEFLSPDDHNRLTGTLIDYEKGGVALNDPSQGLNYQVWRLEYSPDTDDFTVFDEANTPTVLINAPDVTEIALSFDQNMRPCIAYVQSGATKLYWFDASVAAAVTTEFTGIQQPLLALDIKVKEFLTFSDIMFVYLRGNVLCYRRQRDRYEIEYEVRTLSGDKLQLLNVGLNRGNRFQFYVRNAS